MQINITDTKQWDDLCQEFNHLIINEEQLNKALYYTTSDVTGWLRGEAYRELAPKLGIPASVLKNRFKKFRVFSLFRGGKVWLGVNGVPFHYLRPLQLNKGVMTQHGSYYEPDAFVTRLKKTGRQIVFKRRGKTWEDKDGKRQRGPMDVVRADIDDACRRWLIRTLMSPAFDAKCYARFEHHLGHFGGLLTHD